MERLTFSGTKEAKSNVSIRDVVNKLAEYEDLEEQGLLLKLPCKVGDTIYLIDEDEIKFDRVSIVAGIELDEDTVYIMIADDDCKHSISSSYSIDDFGETVFLTYEQAEKRLKEMEGEVNENR